MTNLIDELKVKVEWFMARTFGEPFTSCDTANKQDKAIVLVGHIYRGKYYIAGELWA